MWRDSVNVTGSYKRKNSDMKPDELFFAKKSYKQNYQ